MPTGRATQVVARVAVAVLAAGGMAGCGGGDEQTAGRTRPSAPPAREAPAKSGPAPTKRAFVRRADRLCAASKRRAAPISAAIDAKIADEDALGVAAELRKALSLAGEFLAKMRALTPPKGDEAGFRSYLEIVAEQKRRIPPLIEALEAEDISTVEVLADELRQGNRRGRRVAQGYGLTMCGPEGLPGR